MSLRLTKNQIIVSKTLVHAANLFALIWLYFAAVNGYLGGDPVKGLIHFTGKGILHMLLLTLLVTPLATYLKLGFLYQFRRLLGLYCFFWAVLHVLTYMSLELAWNFSLIAEEIVSRPYLVFGMLAWTILFLLAITSPKAVQSKMGRNWQRLHSWVYVAVLLGSIHYYWSVKSEIREPAIYLLVAVVLLTLRHKKIRRWLF